MLVSTLLTLSIAGVFNASPTAGSSPPVEKDAVPTASSQQNLRDPQPSPATSEQFYSPHLSQLSELEGSSGIIRTLHPNVSDAYRGFDGREP